MVIHCVISTTEPQLIKVPHSRLYSVPCRMTLLFHLSSTFKTYHTMLFLLPLSFSYPVFSTLALKKSFYNLELSWDFRLTLTRVTEPSSRSSSGQQSSQDGLHLIIWFHVLWFLIIWFLKNTWDFWNLTFVGICHELVPHSLPNRQVLNFSQPVPGKAV